MIYALPMKPNLPTKPFTKKIYTFSSLGRDVYHLLRRLPQGIALLRQRPIQPAFAEKIMLAITAVNDCVYCSWFHTQQALKSGLTPDEITHFLNLDYRENATEYEYRALLYAQHYAETDRQPDADCRLAFEQFYGEKTAQAIYLYMDWIYMGNLGGNTFSAFISRLQGQPARNSSVWFELSYFMLTAVYMLPLHFYLKRKNQSQDQPKEAN